MSAVLPSASILPPCIERASRTEKRSSTVRIFPFTRTVSGVCAHTGKIRLKRTRVQQTIVLIRSPWSVRSLIKQSQTTRTEEAEQLTENEDAGRPLALLSLGGQRDRDEVEIAGGKLRSRSDQENAASATETAQTGWLFQKNVLSNHPGASRHPSCPEAVAKPKARVGPELTARHSQ